MRKVILATRSGGVSFLELCCVGFLISCCAQVLCIYLGNIYRIAANTVCALHETRYKCHYSSVKKISMGPLLATRTYSQRQ